MQQIERYGVIALLFLLVTIVVVALWDGGDPAQAGQGDEVAKVEDPRAKVPARNVSVPNRQTRPQSQPRTTPRPSLSGGAESPALRSRGSQLISPGGVPADPNARTNFSPRNPGGNRAKTRPVQN
ncbi:MAG: hypothetical protein KDB61_13990, partial [Planctomycetes bacterium]|nr:hypothetical protein [Planctomycetota bacterium]